MLSRPGRWLVLLRAALVVVGIASVSVPPVQVVRPTLFPLCEQNDDALMRLGKVLSLALM